MEIHAATFDTPHKLGQNYWYISSVAGLYWKKTLVGNKWLILDVNLTSY